MNEEADVQQESIIAHLGSLNANVERQMSMGYAFRNGIIHGLGFIIGSTVLTALVVTFVLQFMGDSIFADVIAWITRTAR